MISHQFGMNEAYFERARPFLESANEHSPGAICYCIGSLPEYTSQYTHIEFHQVPSENLVHPYMLQNGDFLEHCQLPEEAVVLFTDMDVVMQRMLAEDERQLLKSLEEGQVCVGWNAGEGDSLLAEWMRLQPTLSLAEFLKKWPFRTQFQEVYNAGVMAMTVSTWRQVFRSFRLHWPSFHQCFEHPAKNQWLLSWIFDSLDVVEMPEHFHTHGCYSMVRKKPPARHEWADGRLLTSGRMVCLRHNYNLPSESAAPIVTRTSEAAPTGDELASIIILCCNQLNFTRLCLESVLRWNRTPFELILIDNGSTDGTLEYLHEIEQRSQPGGVTVIRNQDNLGFAAGCNQGLEVAKGEYLILLNNDTIVTQGWLDGLIKLALHDWPKIGMVGPVSNYVAPPQQIAIDYEHIEEIDAFAERRRREFAGKAAPTERLIGFCLLMRRDVFNKIGSLDERFGVGFFEDDDLCVRARRAGYRLAIALDIFIHHFGSQTFAALGVDTRALLQENLSKFEEKWGAEYAGKYRLPPVLEPGPIPAEQSQKSSGERGKVSLCLIVKNEEHHLPECLQSVKGLVEEIIVVDTGSTDRTIAIAEEMGAKVFSFPWIDHFAAARNVTLSYATGDWIFWMDADDRLDSDNRERLARLFANLPNENLGFVMKCLCLPDQETGTATVVDHIRLFRNRPEIRWKYRVHEQILPAIRASGGDVRWSDVVIQHVGYQDPALRKRKLERDTRLLQRENDENPDDPFTLFNLGSIFHEQKQWDKALVVLERSLARSQPSDSIVRKLYVLIAQCHRHMNRSGEALHTCQTGRGLYPDDIELLSQEGLVRHDLGDHAGASACLERVLTSQEAGHFASVDTGLRGYKTHHNLAVIYQDSKKPADAERHWRLALKEQPEFVPALVGLGDLLVTSSRDATQVVEALKILAPPASALLEGRSALAHHEFSQAKTVFGQLIDRDPTFLPPRIFMSHALLQEGLDWAGAEQALKAVIELDPQNAEAAQNLRVLRQRRSAASR